MTQGQFIPGEHIDVLSTERERIKRMADLYKAAALFNANGSVVQIKVLKEGKASELSTSVIAAGSRSIMCSEGLNIPIHSILSVRFN